jgi:hypothetical protein
MACGRLRRTIRSALNQTCLHLRHRKKDGALQQQYRSLASYLAV